MYEFLFSEKRKKRFENLYDKNFDDDCMYWNMLVAQYVTAYDICIEKSRRFYTPAAFYFFFSGAIYPANGLDSTASFSC